MQVSVKNCCCEKLWNAIKNVNDVPINLDNEDFPCGIEYLDESVFAKYFCSRDDYLRTFPYDAVIDFCPFCGKKISVFTDTKDKSWLFRHNFCYAFLSWFDDIERPAVTPIFEYDHRNNQFYMHKRKGFGNGLIPVTYCIYCGEPLSKMINDYGLPKEIRNSTHPDAWWKKRGL